MIKIAILGYGTVGSGVYEVFRTNQADIDRRAGQEIRVKYVLDLRDFPGDPVEEVLVHDFDTVVNDPEIRVVAEVMGGTGAAYAFTKRALEAGKSVCTSNKALVAEHGRELMEIAAANHVSYLFEASCGGGIPIIRVINHAMTADKVDEVAGILNGTTNYMLYKMDEDGSTFEAALKEAQARGYAEADPTADIEGHDACRKIAILSTLSYGRFVDYKNVPTEGISRITTADMDYARAMQSRIKLLGMSKSTPAGIEAIVAPFLVDCENSLYNVNDVFNGIFLHSNMLGDSMFYGSGAGKLPTASAVAADIIDAARHAGMTIRSEWGDEPADMVDPGEAVWRFFVRIKDGNAEEAAGLFGEGKEIRLESHPDETGFVTGELKQSAFDEACKKLGDRVRNVIRIKD